MPNTPRLGLQYPDEGQDPFFGIIKSFFEGLDSFIQSCVADRNLFLRGGGTVSFNSGTGQISWSAALELWDLQSGFRYQIAGPGTVTLADGAFAYIDVNRVLTQTLTINLQVAQNLNTPGAGKIVVVFRNGTKVVFRNGIVLDAGFSGEVINNGGTADVRTGTEPFAAVTFKDVTFSTPMPSTSYRVIGLVGDSAKSFFAPAAQRGVNGFRIQTVDGAAYTGNVDWKVERT
jgi:hypothetical protein